MKYLTQDGPYAYFQRDISWLSFNYRVLMEAKDPQLALFERIKFLSIYSSNLEEFFRVRVSEHARKVCDVSLSEQERAEAVSVLDAIHKEVSVQVKEYDAFFETTILQDLAAQQIILYDGKSVDPAHQSFVETYFQEEVYPFLEPMLIMKEHINTFIRDNRLYLVIQVVAKGDDSGLMRKGREYCFLLKVPYSKVPRFVELPSHEGRTYLMFAEDMIKLNLSYIFPGFDVKDAYTIRVSRDADFMLSSESRQTLVQELKKQVRKRKLGTANRLVYESRMPHDILEFLCKSYGFALKKCIPEGSHLNLEDLAKLPNPVGVSLMEQLPETMRIESIDKSVSLIEAIRNRDRVLQFPYHSFDYLLRFLSEAAFDPAVTEIKLTQYRVAANSAVVNKLVRAAHNGKKVTVFVELKARFDEENNMAASEQMRQAGIQIVYSLPKLKVHAKMLLVIRKGESEAENQSIACFSTGNFNEKTAAVYADTVLFTAHQEIAQEMQALFEILEQGSMSYSFKHLLVAQFNMIPRLEELIDGEIERAKRGEYAEIMLKMNGLQDVGMIDKLYEASLAGVKIELIVRGICCLVPQQAFSKNIRITRLVDSYLEHARVWYFYAGGEELMYLTSADWMRRNLLRRIETAVPIYDAQLKEEMKAMLYLQLNDSVKGCWLDEDLRNQYKQYPQDVTLSGIRAQRDFYALLKQYDN